MERKKEGRVGERTGAGSRVDEGREGGGGGEEKEEVHPKYVRSGA